MRVLQTIMTLMMMIPRGLLMIPWVSEIMFQILGIPVASRLYLNWCGDLVKVIVGGRPTIITSRFNVARHVFRGNGFNYTSRMALDSGLDMIGMLDQGIIWNNKTKDWKAMRHNFQTALGNKTLEIVEDETSAAVKMAKDTFRGGAIRNGGRLDMLAFLRLVTLEITNRLMLGVEMDNRTEVVEAVVDYFKSWEFFLIRPRILYLTSPLAYFRNRRAVQRLNDLTGVIVRKKEQEMDGADNINDVTNNFLTNLILEKRQGKISHENVVQSVLEMLIAGTDTSSVTLFYTFVALAGNKDWEENVHSEVSEVDLMAPLPSLPVTDAVLKESMRIKPVGPVVLRRSLQGDIIDELKVEAGDNIIISLEEMHKREDLFNSPEMFNPQRFLEGEKTDQGFLPFGTGPKGCVGQFLAMREMRTVMVILIKEFKLRLVAGEELGSLKVRWDIAQQPVDQIIMELIRRDVTNQDV